VVNGKAGRTGRAGSVGANGLLRPEWRDPIQAVTDRYWVEYSVDIAHDLETQEACNLVHDARKELFGRAWVEDDAEQTRLYSRAVQLAEEA
jgi:hypothetical protein